MAIEPLDVSAQAPQDSGVQPLGTLTPDQSAATLGHANGLLGNILGSFNNFSQGVAKGEVETLQNIASPITKPLGMDKNNLTPEQLQPQGTGETVGKITGEVAPYMVGGEEAGASFLSKLGTRAVGALKNFGIGTAQIGDVKQGAGIAVGGEALNVLAKPVESLGAGVAKMFIPKSDQEAGLLQAYKAGTSFVDRVSSILKGNSKAPSTAASTAFQKGLMGTESMMGVQAKRAQSKLWTGLIKPALDQSKVQVEIPSFFQQAEQKIMTETKDPTRQGVLMNALQSIKEDFGNVGKISLAQLQKYKEGWAEFVPEKAYKGQSIAGAVNDVRNTLAGMARENIYNALGDDVKQAYLDYGNLYGISALGRKAMAGGIVKAGGTFTGLKGLFEMATVPAGTIGGQTIYKIGQGMEIFGAAGARTLGEALGLTGQSTQNSSSTSQ